MLINYVMEFTKIVEHCKANGKGITTRAGGLAYDRNSILQMLNQNKYEEAAKKIKVWRSLNWIFVEDNKTTKRVYVSAEKRYHRMMVFNLLAYETLCELIKQPAEKGNKNGVIYTENNMS